MVTWKHTRWFLAALLLLWSGSPGFQAPIDDLYIMTAFAHELVRTGQLQWTTGEVVEGVTSIPWTVVVAAGPVLGIDAALWARIGSVLVALGFLALLSRRAHGGAGGTLILWVTAAWTSFSFWALSGFEMTLFAALVALGWTAVLEQRWNRGAAFLVLAALVRPEGWALALAASGLAWVHIRTTRQAVGVMAALLTWSLVRYGLFGALLPTPFLVKFVANPRTFAGVAQAAGDLLVAVGPLAAAWLAGERRWTACWPFLLGVGLLVISDGDWFAVGRMTLAGILTLVYASAARITVSLRRASLLIACGLFSAMARAPYGYAIVESSSLADFGRLGMHRKAVDLAYQTGFITPVLQEIPWVIQGIADGDCLLTADVGILGNVQGVCIRDSVGLVDRAYAEHNSGLGPNPNSAPASEDIVAQRVIWKNTRPTVDGMALDAEWLSTPGDWALAFWRRPGAPLPTAETIAARWLAIAERYPWQPDLWWGWGVFASEAGYRNPTAVISTQSWRWPKHVLATETEEYISFADRRFLEQDYIPGRGFVLEKGGERRSRPVYPDETISLVLDSDYGPVTLYIGWSGEDCPLERSVLTSSKGAFALPPAPCSSARVSVWYVDDGAGEGDRNAYIGLRARREGDLLLPPMTVMNVTLEGEPPAEWIVNRGWALWWNRTLHTPPLPAGAAVDVSFDVDSPGTDGAHATLAWEPACTNPTSIIVDRPMTYRIGTPCAARLAITFENDRSLPGDRNLYVGVQLADKLDQRGTGIVTTPPASVPPVTSP